MENAFWNLWELGIVYINTQHTGVFQGMSLASGCANSGGLKHFRHLKNSMSKIWFHWNIIFDKLVKNLKKCLTYPSATKDERYKGRGNREKVDQTEGENSQTSKCYQQHGRRNGWRGNTCTLKTWRQVCHLPRWIWGKLFKQARCKKSKFRVITHKKIYFLLLFLKFHKSQISPV